MDNNDRTLPDTPETDALMRLYLTDPFIRSALMMWKRGNITLEHALMFMVVSLQDQKTRYFNAVMVALRYASHPDYMQAVMDSLSGKKVT